MRRPPRSWLIGRTTIQPDSRKSSTKSFSVRRQDRRHTVVPGRRPGLQRTADITEGCESRSHFVPGYYNDVGLIAKQARDKGITVPLIGGDGWDSEQLYKIGGTALNGSYFTNHYSPLDTDPRVVKLLTTTKRVTTASLTRSQPPLMTPRTSCLTLSSVPSRSLAQTFAMPCKQRTPSPA